MLRRLCGGERFQSGGHRLPGEKIQRLPGPLLSLLAHRHVAWNGCTVNPRFAMT